MKVPKFVTENAINHPTSYVGLINAIKHRLPWILHPVVESWFGFELRKVSKFLLEDTVAFNIGPLVDLLTQNPIFN